HRRVRRLAGAARVEVQAAGEYDTVEAVEQGVEIHVLGVGRQDDRQAAGHGDRVRVADGQAGEGGGGLGGGGEVGVDADEGARARGGHGQPSLVTGARRGRRR